MSIAYYLIIWACYLFCVLAGLFGAWRISRNWPYALQAFGRIALIVLLLTPAPQADGWMAPAFVAAIFDQMQGVEGGWFHSGVYLVIAACFGGLLYLFLVIAKLVRRRAPEMTGD